MKAKIFGGLLMKNFRTYNLAVEFYRLSRPIELPRTLKEQLSRAASSVVLNLAEGYGRFSPADQKRFYCIAMGSLRECQAILDISEGTAVKAAAKTLDCLAAHIYRLIQSRRG
jgi:four helix bundle protein